MSWLKKEMEESAKARAEQNTHIKPVSKTRTSHICDFCKHEIVIGSPAKVVTEEILNTYINKSFYKTYYYHDVCFLQTPYSIIKPKSE